MASSCCNSSTPVPLLRTPFNTISYFSDQMAYLPNMLWYSRQIHQRGHSSPRSPSSTIQPGQTVLPVSGPSIVPADNDPKWEDAPTTNPITNLTANRPTSSTCSWSKPYWSDNTNEQLAEVLSWLANTLNSSQTSSPNTNTRGTKAHIPDIFSDTEPNKLNSFLFQCCLYFCTNLVQFDIDIVKINFAMTYLMGVAQDWFEVGLNQKTRSSFKTGSLTGIYLWTSYVNILVSQIPLVKWPTCWTISAWSLVTRFSLTMWTLYTMPPN